MAQKWRHGTAKSRRRVRPRWQGLDQLALRYVGRFATTRAKLRAYLARKVRERGWDGAANPIWTRSRSISRRLGYVDDAAYAMAKSHALTGAVFGKRAASEQLHVAGIGEEDGERRATMPMPRRSLPLCVSPSAGRLGRSRPRRVTDPGQRQKALAAMTCAGHGFGLARAIVGLRPGMPIDHEELAERFRNNPA